MKNFQCLKAVKNLIWLIVVFIQFPSYGQTSLGLRTGASTFFYKVVDEDHSMPRSFFSVPWELPVKQWFSVQPELSFTQRDIKMTNGSTARLLHRESFNLDLILCPKLVYRSSKLGLFGEVGPLIGLTLLEKRETGYAFYANKPMHNYDYRRTVSLGTPAIEFGVIGRIGTEYYAKAAVLQLGFQMYKGFTDMSDLEPYNSPVKHLSRGFFIGGLVKLGQDQEDSNN